VAGYSGTPLRKKLGIMPGHRVLVGGASPSGFLDEVDDVTWVRQARPPIDVAVIFTTTESDFRRRLVTVMKAVVADGAIWVAWPKRSSGVATDLTEDVIRTGGDGDLARRQQGVRDRRHVERPAPRRPRHRPSGLAGAALRHDASGWARR
jgi:hypothetical protein